MHGDTGKLRITLKSDLCVGSGYSYAGIVDSDCCYDACGLPYIPAKRLKGCLREAAEMIGLSGEQIGRIFGEAGEDRARGVLLRNGYIVDYGKLQAELSGMDKKLRTYVTPQSVLEEFTTVKAQTKIMENGIAKDNSLRFTRTVAHYSPVDSKSELEFIAEVFFADLDDGDIALFEKTVRALRNIGMNRNRGLGSVRCVLEVSDSYADTEGLSGMAMDDEEIYRLSYIVRNTAPLVLSSGDDRITEKYISGQSVLGWFAGSYLQAGGAGDSEEFAELFLKNSVIFSALYPCEAINGSGDYRVYYPAPSYINRLKKTKRYVNVSKPIPRTLQECEQAGIEEYFASGNGNQPKRLSGQFICVEDGEVYVHEVRSDLIYHHTKKSRGSDMWDEGLLYAFEAVREQQMFAGTITGKGKALKKLAGLLQNGVLRFGKSKSAQYGTCVLEGAPKITKLSEPAVFKAGSRILVTLRSDAVFTEDTGCTVRCADVRRQICDALGMKAAPEEEGEFYDEIETKELSGYYTVWNLRRQSIPAVCAGSTFEFLLTEDLAVSDAGLYAGERIGEGYGRLAVVENNEPDCRMQKGVDSAAAALPIDASRGICRRVLLKELKERILQTAQRKSLKLSGTAALGRITLMLTDSCSQELDDARRRFRDFYRRLESIKTKQLHDQAINMLKKYICADSELTGSGLQYLEAENLEELSGLYKKYFGEEDFREEMQQLWSDYLMAILTFEKYKMKREGAQR